jgi:hypothetical protein
MLLLSIFAVNCFAFPAPFWLREGAYAYYHIDSNPIVFENGTSIWRGNGTYGWKCVGMTGNSAILEVSVNITGRALYPNQTKTAPYASAETHMISIDVETREAFCGDEYLGFLPYWIPANIQELPFMSKDELPDWVPKDIEWRYIENFASYENVTTYGLLGNGSDVETPYKTFKGDQVMSILGAFSSVHGFSYLYEKDSGLFIKTAMASDNFLRKVINVKNYIDNFLLEDTNIFSLPQPASPLNILLPYIIIATTLMATTASIYFIKIRKKP